MTFLIDHKAQERIAGLIDAAVQRVLINLPSHGDEEGMTAALGQELTRHRIDAQHLRVDIKYRQHSKYTEESNSGADGSFLVRVVTPDATVQKATLFQAKLLGGVDDVRALKMSAAEATRLQRQASNMLQHTDEAVAMFYTHKNIYVVDAGDYSASPISRTPLSQKHRLITLGTYLGKWMPRCTKGDMDEAVVKKSMHMEGFKHGLTLDVVSQHPAVRWENDQAEDAWRRKG